MAARPSAEGANSHNRSGSALRTPIYANGREAATRSPPKGQAARRCSNSQVRRTEGEASERRSSVCFSTSI